MLLRFLAALALGLALACPAQAAMPHAKNVLLDDRVLSGGGPSPTSEGSYDLMVLPEGNRCVVALRKWDGRLRQMVPVSILERDMNKPFKPGHTRRTFVFILEPDCTLTWRESP